MYRHHHELADCSPRTVSYLRYRRGLCLRVYVMEFTTNEVATLWHLKGDGTLKQLGYYLMHARYVNGLIDPLAYSAYITCAIATIIQFFFTSYFGR